MNLHKRHQSPIGISRTLVPRKRVLLICSQTGSVHLFENTVLRVVFENAKALILCVCSKSGLSYRKPSSSRIIRPSIAGLMARGHDREFGNSKKIGQSIGLTMGRG